MTTGCAGVQRHTTARGVKAQDLIVAGDMYKEIAVEAQTKC